MGKWRPGTIPFLPNISCYNLLFDLMYIKHFIHNVHSKKLEIHIITLKRHKTNKPNIHVKLWVCWKDLLDKNFSQRNKTFKFSIIYCKKILILIQHVCKQI